MADQWASEADVAAYDRAAARTFGRTVRQPTGEPAWRTGEPGQLTEAEYDDEAALTFGRYRGAQEAEVRHRVEESRRQRAIECQLLDQGPRVGWVTAARSAGVSAAVAESVRFRAGLPVTTATATTTPARPALSEGRTPPAGGRSRQRMQIAEVVGREPRPSRWPR